MYRSSPADQSHFSVPGNTRVDLVLIGDSVLRRSGGSDGRWGGPEVAEAVALRLVQAGRVVARVCVAAEASEAERFAAAEIAQRQAPSQDE